MGIMPKREGGHCFCFPQTFPTKTTVAFNREGIPMNYNATGLYTFQLDQKLACQIFPLSRDEKCENLSGYVNSFFPIGKLLRTLF